MKNLQIHNPRFITYQDTQFTIDVLGGVDTTSVERMICTLRISYADYPPFRTTLDLYNDSQSDGLIRDLCDKWELRFSDCAKSIHGMVLQLESYRFECLRYPNQQGLDEPILSEDQKTKALACLSSKQLLERIREDFLGIGIPKDDESALILFLAMASRNLNRPLSVLCTGTGSYHYPLIQKLMACLPESQKSIHTHMSENALYYFEQHQVAGKVLVVEDLEWTTKMLKPLMALQNTGRLIKTQASKNKDGLLYATTFDLRTKLCLIAYSEESSKAPLSELPFLKLNLGLSPAQEKELLHYERQSRAGTVNHQSSQEAYQNLRALLQCLPNQSIRNPYAPLLELPKELEDNHRALLIFLDFIEVVTFFFQHQREQKVDPETGEVYLETEPEDIALAIELLSNSLFKAREGISTPARKLLEWMQTWEGNSAEKGFTAIDIRKVKMVHPRTLNRYLKELCYFNYLSIAGGNKYKGGYRYRLSDFQSASHPGAETEAHFKALIQRVRDFQKSRKGKNLKEAEEGTVSKSSGTVGQKALSKPQVRTGPKKVSGTVQKREKLKANTDES
jgi:hypothetical protein